MFVLLLQSPSFTITRTPLPLKSPVRRHKWSNTEDAALVEFLGVGKLDPDYDFDSPPTSLPSFRVTLSSGQISNCQRRKNYQVREF